jgi:hypothetical protein
LGRSRLLSRRALSVLERDARLRARVEVRESAPVRAPAAGARPQAERLRLALAAVGIIDHESKVIDAGPMRLEEVSLRRAVVPRLDKLELQVADHRPLVDQLLEALDVRHVEVGEAGERRVVVPRPDPDRLVEGHCSVDVLDGDADVVDVLKRCHLWLLTPSGTGRASALRARPRPPWSR